MYTKYYLPKRVNWEKIGNKKSKKNLKCLRSSFSFTKILTTFFSKFHKNEPC